MARRQWSGFFAARIGTHMARHGLRRLEDFADAHGLGRTTVYSLVHGRRASGGQVLKPSVDTLVKLAAALEVPAHVLLYELEPAALRACAGPVMRRIELHTADSSGAAPAAGLAGDAVWLEERFASGRDLVAFRVLGDGMAAGRHPIHDGAVVLVDRLSRGADKDQVVARLKDGAFVCRVLRLDRSGEVACLLCANPECSDGASAWVAPDAVVEVVGRVVRTTQEVSDGG